MSILLFHEPVPGVPEMKLRPVTYRPSFARQSRCVGYSRFVSQSRCVETKPENDVKPARLWPAKQFVWTAEWRSVPD